MSREVLLVPTGVANTRSVVEAFVSLGTTCRLASDAAEVYGAGWVVLPGVGSFRSGAEALGLDMAEALRERVSNGHPTLGICLGFQLFFESSEESDHVTGLGVIPGRVRRFDNGLRVPQMGWNQVSGENCQILGSGYAYFANSYAASHVPADWQSAKADYGGSFIAGAEHGPVVGCQFHPELSGAYGLGVLERWLRC